MSSPGGSQQPYPNDQFGQQGPPPGQQPGGFPPPQDGGFPPPQQDGGFPPPQGGSFPPAPARPARSGGGVRRILVTVVVMLVVVGGIAVAARYFGRDAAGNAKVGDCVRQEGSDDVKIVKCDGGEADFTVVGRVENKTQIEAGLGACDDFPDAQQAYWEGEQGEKGLVLCLAPAQ